MAENRITRLRKKHLITWIQHSPHSQVYGFTAADCHKYLSLLIIKVILSAQITAYLLLQFLKTGIGRIIGPAMFQGINAFLADVPWRVKIRLAYTQGYSIRHLAHDIKKLTDTGRFQLSANLGNGIFHGRIFILSSSFSVSARMMP